MEFIRGFLIPCMNFHGCLLLPNVKSVSDALSLWSNNFHSRELKSVFHLFSNLLANRDIDYNSFKDKMLAAHYISDYIRRIYSYIDRSIKDTGNDKNLCYRMSTSLDLDNNDIDVFKDFIESFLHSDNSRKCGISIFLKNSQPTISEIIKKKDIKIKGATKTGFSTIVDSLEKLPKDNKISCTNCSKIGDLIIGLLSPKSMQLEHTDYSFDFICTILEKDHRRLDSESTVLKN